MEETKTNEAFNEGAKVVEKLFNNVNTAMTDMYKKQMDMTTSFYNNLFNSGLGNTNGWNQNNGFPNMFSTMDVTKWFSNPFTNFSATAFQNPFGTSMDKTMKGITEFNQNLLSTLTNGLQGNGTDWNEMSKEYKETIEARLAASKEILTSISEAFNKQLESSIDTNKKTVEEINNQFNLVMKQNQKLWADLFKIFQTPITNQDKKSKDPILFENKKKTNVPMSEIKDHQSK